jgi:hypothetical protein
VKARTKWAIAAVVALVAASATAGVAVGGTLYIKGQDVKLLPKPDLGATAVAKLKNGTAVTWKGADPGNKQLHQVVANGKTGYVLFSNLTPNKPSDEILTADGKPTSAEAFKSSGAASKAMTEAGLKYASGASAEEVCAGIIHLEENSKKQQAKIPEHLKEAGLPGGEK